MDNQSLLSNPIPTPNKTELVVDRIMDYLQNSDVRPGSSVPKETELAASLGVSRTIVREALSHLKLLGLIESRKKRGMILSEPKMVPALGKVLLPKLLEQKTRREVFELRLMLEIGIADALFDRVSNEDLKALAQIIKGEQALMEQEKTNVVMKKLIAIDTNFHAYLYEITGNTILQSLQEVFLPTIEHVIKHQFDIDPMSYGQVSHQRLLDVLKSGTAEDFRLEMREHLSVHFDQLFHTNEKSN